MSRIIINNSRRVYKTGENYRIYGEKYKELQNRLKQVLSNIESCWSGSDNNNFRLLFKDYIESLSNISTFLEEKSELLKQNSLSHNTSDNNFSSKMKDREDDIR
jgi:uncharacterized protein YukE